MCSHLIMLLEALLLYFIVPSALLVGVRVAEVCPALRLQWTLPDPQLLGGPEDEVFYVISYNRTGAGGVRTNRSFGYNSSVTVSDIMSVTGWC